LCTSFYIFNQTVKPLLAPPVGSSVIGFSLSIDVEVGTNVEFVIPNLMIVGEFQGMADENSNIFRNNSLTQV
jgi:hypothetical protein